MNYRILFVVAFIWFSTSLSFAQPTVRWAVGSKVPHGSIESWAIAADAFGNVYENFEASSSVSPTRSYFGPDSTYSINGIVSTDSNGNYRWILGSTGPFLDLTTDRFNNVYGVGTFYSLLIIGTDTVRSTATGFTPTMFCAKITPSGSVTWLRKICDTATPTGVVTDSAGNVYISGSYTGRHNTIGSTAIANSGAAGRSDALLVRLDSSGHATWAKCFGGDSDDQVVALTVSPAGDIFFTGKYNSPSFSLDGVSFSGPVTPYNNNFFVGKINTGGTTSWAYQVSHAFDVSDITADNAENIYLAGRGGSSTTFGPGTLSTTGVGIFLASFNAAGGFRWAHIDYPGPHYWASYAASADNCGNVWVSGFGDTGLVIRADPMFILRWDTFGHLVDSTYLPSGGDDINDIVTDNAGHLYVGGDYWGGGYTTDTLYFGPYPLVLQDSTLEALFVVKYSYPLCSAVDLRVQPPAQLNLEPVIYPNPAINEISVTIPENAAKQDPTLDIYDIAGRLIMSCDLAAALTTLNISMLQPGMYTCFTQAGGNRYSSKLVIVR